MLKIITTRYSGLPKVTKYKLGLYIFANDELKNMLAEELVKNQETNPELAGDFQELLNVIGDGGELNDEQKNTLTDFMDELELPDDDFDLIASQAEVVGGFETGELGGSGKIADERPQQIINDHITDALRSPDVQGAENKGQAISDAIDVDALRDDLAAVGADLGDSSVADMLSSSIGEAAQAPTPTDAPITAEEAVEEALIQITDEAGGGRALADVDPEELTEAIVDRVGTLGIADADIEDINIAAEQASAAAVQGAQEAVAEDEAGVDVEPGADDDSGPPGPPPRPGLVWSPDTKRWIRPMSQRRVDRLMVNRFAKLETRTVEGVEIFSSGTWTDSHGMQKTWTHDELNQMAATAGDVPAKIPLKTGHTSDEFNQQVALAIGVPIELITGEGGGGQIALGDVTNVRRDGDKLVADFTGVPALIADLIEGGQFRSVSSEIEMNEDMEVALSGVALLGAEAPAVDNLTPLYEASVFKASADKDNRLWITFKLADISVADLDVEFADLNTKMEDAIKGKKGARTLRALWSTVKDRFASIREAKLAAEKKKEERLAAKQHALPGQDNGGTDGRPPKAWWDRAVHAAKAFGVPDPGAFAGSVWFNNEPFPRESFDSPEAAIGAAVKMSEVMPAWLGSQAESGLRTQNLDHHTPAERLRAVKWIATDLGLPEGSSVDEVITKLTELRNQPEEDMNMSGANSSLAAFQVAVEDLPRIYEALGLTEEATIDDVLAAIQGMAGEGGEGDEGMEGGSPFKKEKTSTSGTQTQERVYSRNPEIAKLQKADDDKAEYIAVLEHKELVAKYLAFTSTWDGIEGTPEDLAEELAVTEETLGEARADALVQSYKKAQETAVASGLLMSHGRSTRGAIEISEDEDDPNAELDPFEKSVNEFAKAENLTYQVALARYGSQNSQEFAKYRVRLGEHQAAKAEGRS